MSESLVSVIIPVYNSEKYLAEAIESVLAQDYRPVEIIILDDGSTDNSADIAGSYASSVRYYYQPNNGLAAAQNKGLMISHGSYCSFLDSDDIWVPDKLTRQIHSFNDNPELDMVFGQVQQFQSPELDYKMIPQDEGSIVPGYSTGAMLIKRDSFFRVGLFETKWHVGDFVDWYLKAAEMGLKSNMLPKVVMKRRIHGKNMGIRERKHQADYVRILKASLDRRRKTYSEGRNKADQ